jgi:hypothetical protein
MSRKEKLPPAKLGRFHYWLLDIAYPRYSSPASVAEYKTDPQEIPEHIRDIVHAILEGRDSPVHPDYCPDLYLGIAVLNLPAEPDRRVRALRYWIALDSLWYEYNEAWTLFHTLPDVKQQALREYAQQWAPPSSPWTWETLLPRIAND